VGRESQKAGEAAVSAGAKTQVLDALHTLVPSQGSRHGPLPLLLVLMTVVTGLVDAFSYLELGRVFVANMTGNVVFLSFDLGGAPGFQWWASLLAIATFVGGAFIGGRIAHTHGTHRGRQLFIAASTQAVLLIAASVAALAMTRPYGARGTAVLIMLLGVGMGVQNATARALAVPDLTTTVLTLTLTGMSADSIAAGGANSRVGRRLLSVLSMFLGGVGGTLMVRASDIPWPLLVATAMLVAVVAAASRTVHADAAWTAAR
jgi:uncharacterized membrane protein YoaK (UPF0700 family)